MSTWILLVLLFNQGASTATMTFHSKASCEAAGKKIESYGMKAVMTFCFEDPQ